MERVEESSGRIYIKNSGHLLRTRSVFRVEKFYMKGCDGFRLCRMSFDAEKEFSFRVFLTIEE